MRRRRATSAPWILRLPLQKRKRDPAGPTIQTICSPFPGRFVIRECILRVRSSCSSLRFPWISCCLPLQRSPAFSGIDVLRYQTPAPTSRTKAQIVDSSKTEVLETHAQAPEVGKKGHELEGRVRQVPTEFHPRFESEVSGRVRVSLDLLVLDLDSE